MLRLRGKKMRTWDAFRMPLFPGGSNKRWKFTDSQHVFLLWRGVSSPLSAGTSSTSHFPPKTSFFPPSPSSSLWLEWLKTGKMIESTLPWKPMKKNLLDTNTTSDRRGLFLSIFFLFPSSSSPFPFQAPLTSAACSSRDRSGGEVEVTRFCGLIDTSSTMDRQKTRKFYDLKWNTNRPPCSWATFASFSSQLDSFLSLKASWFSVVRRNNSVYDATKPTERDVLLRTSRTTNSWHHRATRTS